jgi:hypothetical protein
LRNNRYIFNGEGPHTFVRTTKEFEVSIAEEFGGGCDHWGRDIQQLEEIA